MQIQKISLSFFVAALLLQSVFSFAQTAPKPTAPKTDTSKAQAKPLPTFGAYTNGSKAFVADLKRLLTTNPQLKLKDSKGVSYPVVSFDITWKKKETSDDFKTGKPVTVYTYSGGSLTGNQLTDGWREEISTYIQKGEEITFSTILYMDPKRKVNTKAPSLVLSIQ